MAKIAELKAENDVYEIEKVESQIITEAKNYDESVKLMQEILSLEKEFKEASSQVNKVYDPYYDEESDDIN